eukprot:scaffold29994_cov18-Tisochrysis_lutea.AAC.1
MHAAAAATAAAAAAAAVLLLRLQHSPSMITQASHTAATDLLPVLLLRCKRVRWHASSGSGV